MRYVLMIFCSFTLTRCSTNTKTIAARILDSCKKDSCNQLLKNVTDFKWDKVYVFSQAASLEEVDSTLGFHYNEWQDVGEKILFSSGKSIVYHEDYFPFPEKLENGSTFFKINNSTFIGGYQTAMFSVQKVNHNSGKYYYEVSPLR